MYGNNDWRDYLEHARSHKYIKKIKLGTHTRYFYTPSELKAYYEGLKKKADSDYKSSEKNAYAQYDDYDTRIESDTKRSIKSRNQQYTKDVEKRVENHPKTKKLNKWVEDYNKAADEGMRTRRGFDPDEYVSKHPQPQFTNKERRQLEKEAESLDRKRKKDIQSIRDERTNRRRSAQRKRDRQISYADQKRNKRKKQALPKTLKRGISQPFKGFKKDTTGIYRRVRKAF